MGSSLKVTLIRGLRLLLAKYVMIQDVSTVLLRVRVFMIAHIQKSIGGGRVFVHLTDIP